MISARIRPSQGWTPLLGSFRKRGSATRRNHRKETSIELSQALETRVLLSADPVIGLAAADTTRFESESNTDAFHQIGRATGDGWSASVDQDNEGFLVYGPYTTDFAAGWHTASFILLVDNNTADNLPVVKIDVHDANTGEVLAEKTITRQKFDVAGTYQDFDLTFYSNDDANLEFRTYWLDTSYVQQDAVEVTPISTDRTTFQAETDLAHQIGRADGEGWSANVLDDDEGFLSYGPYTTSLPPGVYSADFRLLVDNNSFDDTDVVTIDVVSDFGETVLAQRTITRNEFNEAGVYQNFRLDFVNTTGEALEFRTYWHGTSYVNLDRVDVTATPTTLEQEYEAETDLFHQIGRADADGWSTSVDLDDEGFLAFGPYTSALTEGMHVALFRLLLDNVTADDLDVVTIDVAADAGQTILAERTLTRSDFDTAFDYQSFALPFINSSGQELEYRVYSHDTSYVRFDNVRVYSLPISQQIFEAEHSPYHDIGRRDGDGWAASRADDNDGYLMSGPFTTSVPPGQNTAEFRLSSSETDGRRDVVEIDVYDAATDTVLAERTLERRDFAQANVYQNFTLDFIAPRGGNLEFRTYWEDNADVRIDRVRVYPQSLDDMSIERAFEDLDEAGLLV